MKIIKYRIVKNYFNGYECQCWRIWFPFWVQMFDFPMFINSFKTIEDAKEFIKNRKKVVWEEI